MDIDLSVYIFYRNEERRQAPQEDIGGRSIKVHLYWAMKNCGGSAEVLKQLMSIPGHYQFV